MIFCISFSSLGLVVGCGVESTETGSDPILEPTPDTPSPTPPAGATPTPTASATATPTPTRDEAAELIKRGRSIYSSICGDCHRAGQGAGKSPSELKAIMQLPQHSGGFGLSRSDLNALSKFLGQ